MTSKAKVIVSIVTLCLIALVAVIAVVAIFAANTQNFNSKVVANYVSDQVVGSVQAKYYVGEQDNIGKFMLSPAGSNKLTFSDDEQAPETELTLMPQDINLSLNENFVVFEYIFTNDGENAYTASLAFSGTAQNVTVYCQDNKKEKLDNFSTILVPELDGTNFTKSIQVEAGTTSYVYVKVVVSIPADDSSFEGDFNWSLVGTN